MARCTDDVLITDQQLLDALQLNPLGVHGNSPRRTQGCLFGLGKACIAKQARKDRLPRALRSPKPNALQPQRINMVPNIVLKSRRPGAMRPDV